MSEERLADLAPLFKACRYDYAAVFYRLGKVSDASLAREIGATRDQIARLRYRFRVAAYDPLRPFEGDLGICPDAVIAEAAGVSIRTVLRRRHSLGVHPYRRQSGMDPAYLLRRPDR